MLSLPSQCTISTIIYVQMLALMNLIKGVFAVDAEGVVINTVHQPASCLLVPSLESLVHSLVSQILNLLVLNFLPDS